MCIKISVITPFFNASKTIISSISSVMEQTYKPIEIILINDGSTDDSLYKIHNYFKYEIETGFIIIINKINEGVSKARNDGIMNAKGEWVAFLDADDYWNSDKLNEQIICLKLFPDCKIFGTSSNILTFKHYKLYLPITYFNLLFKNYFSTSSVLVEKASLKMSGNFNVNKKYSEDYELWMTVLFQNKYGMVINKNLIFYNVINGIKLSNNFMAMFTSELNNYYIQFQKNRINFFFMSFLYLFSSIKFFARILVFYAGKFKVQ